MAKKKKSKPCWTGYEMVGMKRKKGKNVPNCVPTESIDNKLVAVCHRLDEVCNTNGIKYDIICDESDIQGFKLFTKKSSDVSLIFSKLGAYLDGVVFEAVKTRGGTIITFSLEAISESKLKELLSNEEDIMEYSLTEKLDMIFNSPIVENQESDSIFQRFATSLAELGRKMGIGPLQDRLKEQGIKWKKSDDGNRIILYIINDTTNAPQPIASIDAESLANQNQFQETLMNMLDYARGKAPGEFKQEQEVIRQQEKLIRDVSKLATQDNEQEAAQMDDQVDLEAAQRAASIK